MEVGDIFKINSVGYSKDNLSFKGSPIGIDSYAVHYGERNGHEAFGDLLGRADSTWWVRIEGHPTNIGQFICNISEMNQEGIKSLLEVE